MPANLPPEYFNIEQRYREAESTGEKIRLLEELLSVIPKHKGTEHLRGDYKARLAKLRSGGQGGHKSLSRHASAFHVPREGAGQVAVIGGTNTGKSALVRALTRAEPEVADTPYTTWEPLPGMFTVDLVPVQIVDTPSLDRPFVEAELFDLIRRADLILLLVDLNGDPFQQLEDSLALLAQHRIVPPGQPPAENEARRWEIPLLVVANKCDQPASDLDCQAFRELMSRDLPVMPVSAREGRNLEALKQAVLARLEVVRVYAKPPGKDPDLDTPFVFKQGSTLADLGGRVHKDFLNHLKFARVWGEAVRDGQKVAHDYVLHDGDIVELHE